MPEYRIAPLFSKQACGCKGVCELYENSILTNTARRLVLEEPGLEGFHDFSREWIIARGHGKDPDRLEHADRTARARYLDHIWDQLTEIAPDIAHLAPPRALVEALAA